MPAVSANGAYTRLDAGRVFNGRVVQDANSSNRNFVLSVPLVAPRAWVGHARARDNLALTKLSRADARREVALAVARAYLTVVGQHRILETAERALSTARAHEELARSRFTGAVGNRLDVVRASQERAASETRVENQHIALARAQEALGVLLGETGPVDTFEAPLATPPPLDTALREAEGRRADVAAARERAAIAKRTARDSYVDYLPTLSAVGQAFHQTPPITLPTNGWQAQLVLTLPIFDGGTRSGLAREREALEAQARTRLEAALREARSEVRVAFESVRRADRALERANEAAELAREALEPAQLSRRCGFEHRGRRFGASRSRRGDRGSRRRGRGEAGAARSAVSLGKVSGSMNPERPFMARCSQRELPRTITAMPEMEIAAPMASQRVMGCCSTMRNHTRAVAT